MGDISLKGSKKASLVRLPLSRDTKEVKELASHVNGGALMEGMQAEQKASENMLEVYKVQQRRLASMVRGEQNQSGVGGDKIKEITKVKWRGFMNGEEKLHQAVALRAWSAPLETLFEFI